ncbi:TonB-dependent siderophore receptor [Pantoea sp. ACRSH]|uniref:TonB-dependent receptor n=1 Tax=unclassified Pantoea TaxID=2630326 RepID=UPI001EF42429|nr:MULTISPECIES: TonB-dependent siderophore receptor [unclassified Pantoea]MCG7364686.1 TonB-dependent siderophore receptor [Pantoea sp. ACRSH]MCG7395438.1 TonB-dependent siderophore receptor [Pantoea sp. ACRSC]
MRRALSSFRCKPTLLALLVSAGSLPAMAATSSASTPAASTGEAVTAASSGEQTLTVTAAPQSDFQPGGDRLVPAYLDGQVAHGGRLGMLGEQNAMDVPFNVIGYTSKLIQDRQAKTIADVVKNDAGVQSLQGYGNFAETYRIRGFTLDGDDMTFGGLPGVVPRQVMDTSLIDRVEIFKGANGLLNGAASSGVGGMINLEPKHADDLPLTRVGVDYSSAQQIGTTTDISRRFGDDNQFGVRLNAVHREGETGVDGEQKRTTAASLGLDYRGERLRTSLDLGYQKKTFHDGDNGVNISGVDAIPKLPSNSHNYSQDWVYSDIESEFGMARAEYDVTDSWTLYGAVGAQHSHELGDYASPKLTDADGNAQIGRLDTNRIINNFSGMAGLRGRFDTGFISHKVNVGYAAYTSRNNTAWRMAYGTNTESTNIYHTSKVPNPTNNLSGGNYGDPLTTGRNRTQGYLLSDTLGVLNDRVQLTLGARHQKVVVRNYSNATGAEDTSSRYTDSRWMPTYGILYKPLESVALYANHTESLQPGEVAPNNASNYGTTTGIVHAKQNEVGVKVDFQRVGGSLALFEIKKPSGILNRDGSYGLDGEQRNRGVELNVFGEPVLGVRLNGSATWIDPEMTKTENGSNNGKDAIGVPRYNLVLGAEYDIRPVEGLTATAQLQRTGSQWADAANSKKVDSYTTLDLGMRYRMKVRENDLVWRVGLDNVTNEKYWSSVDDTGTYLFRGDGRTLKAGVSYDF